MMKTLNLFTLASRLSQSFINVDLAPMDISEINEPNTRTISQFMFDGFLIGVHVSTNGSADEIAADTAVWYRFCSINYNRFFKF